MEAYLFLFGFLLIIILSLVYSVLISRKRPPYIREHDAGHDMISVFVWTRRGYREYIFVKTKNDRYRMKCKILDIICTVFAVFQLILGLFILSLFQQEFVKNPDSIPAVIGFVIWLVANVFFANSLQIEAWLYFRKAIKDLT